MTIAVAMLLSIALAGPGAGFTEAAREKGVVIYNREKPGSEIKEVLAIGDFDAPPERVHAVLDDLGNYQDFMPYAKETRIVKREPGVVWTYERINAPFASERDYTIKVTCVGDRATSIKHSFTLAPDTGPKPIDGVVRLQTLDGYWQLEPLEGGKRTRGRYYIYTSPGGSIPAWVANLANNTAVPGVYEAVRKRLSTAR